MGTRARSSKARAVMVLSVFVMFGGAFAQFDGLPSCLVTCVNKITNPCNGRSLPTLMNCIENICGSTPINMTLNLDPMAEYSCQDSFVPGTNEPSQPLALSSNGDCVNSLESFKSFITGSDPSDPIHSNMVASQCRVEFFADNGCHGKKAVIDSADIKHSGCTFVGGKSARLNCSIPPVRNAAYKSLGDLCAHHSFPRHNSSTPNPSYKTNGTATATGARSSTALLPPTSSPIVSATPGVASMEKHVQRSLAGLIAVIVAAVVLI